MTRHAWPLLVLTFLSGCGGSPPSQSNTPPASPTPAAPSVAPVRVLMITATAAFRHDSIPTARSVVSSLASRTGTFTVTATETLTDVSASRLASTDVLMFALTTGELAFDDTQKAAIVSFVDRGGGFIGVHSATDTLYQWPDYGRLVGAYFKEHPWTQTASVVVEDRSHPAAAGVESPFRLLDEFYTFQRNPRGSVAVLLSLDPRSVNADGDFPLAWTQSFGRGRGTIHGSSGNSRPRSCGPRAGDVERKGRKDRKDAREPRRHEEERRPTKNELQAQRHETRRRELRRDGSVTPGLCARRGRRSRPLGAT